MEVREAIQKAKDWIRGVYSDEDLMNLGLEEIQKDYNQDLWLITVGFSRPWDANRGLVSVMSSDKPYSRSFKIVTLDDKSGDVISIKNRD